jgi:hypothetical protein
MLQVLERISRRMDALEGRSAERLPPRSEPGRLPGKRRGR